MAYSPPRSEADLVAELDTIRLGDHEIVLLPADLWAKDGVITVVIAVGSQSEEAATMAAAQYAMHVLSDTDTLVLSDGNRIALRPMLPPYRNAPMIDLAPPSVRKVGGTKGDHTWVITTATVQPRRTLKAGKYRVGLSPRDIKLAVPSLDPWAIRFEPERELEVHANPN